MKCSSEGSYIVLWQYRRRVKQAGGMKWGRNRSHDVSDRW